MKLVVNAYARSGAESADQELKKRRGSSVPPQQWCLSPAAAFFAPEFAEKFLIFRPLMRAEGPVPSFIAAVLPAETDSEIAVLKIDGDGRLTDVAAQCIHWDAWAVLSCAYC